MTDVETRTPQKTPKKRKSVEGKQESPKKPKLENGKTPQKFQTPKQQKNQNKKAQNSVQKSNKKQKQNSESETDKKVKPFAGTAQIQSPKPGKPAKTGNQNSPKKSGERKPTIERKPRRKLMSMIKDQLKSDDTVAKSEVIKNLETKLQAIQSRPNLTKTAMRKIKLLKRLKNIAEGKAPAQGTNSENKPKSDMTESAKRRDRKRRAALKSEGQEGENVGKKGQQAKGKNAKKTIKQEVKIEKPEEASEEEESDDEDESGEEQTVEGEESGDEEESGEEEEGSGEEEEGSDEEEDGSDDDEEDSDDDDDEEDEVSLPQPPVKSQSKPVTSRQQAPKTKNDSQKQKFKKDFQGVGEPKPQKVQQESKTGKEIQEPGANKNKEAKRTNKPVELADLKKSDLVSKNQSRYVVFVGNIPYDTTTRDLKEHFGTCGEIKHVRIPTEKKTDRPRGFAYVEAVDEDTYQKCLSRHHSQMKGRRINVLYTQGGKKKGEYRKKEIKVKNFKLGALRQQGKLLGSTKDSQKRSFRRKKQKMNQESQES